MVQRLILLISVLSFCMSGCSKKPIAEDAPLVEKNVSRTPNPQINADLASVNKNLDAHQYDAAVGSLVGLKQIPKTEAEQKAYEKKLHEASDALSQRASQGDEQAAQSYHVLGRFMTGR
jgi:hypothetical protein